MPAYQRPAFMKHVPYFLPLLLAVGSLCYGTTTINVYNSDDMSEARGVGEDYELILHASIEQPLPKKESNYYHSSDYIFTSADVKNPVHLMFYGEADERGEVLHNSAATFKQLGSVSFVNWVNTWTDFGGGKSDAYASAYGGALSGGEEDQIIFRENGAVSFNYITYDSSAWGQSKCEIKVHGGAIHTSSAVEFVDNALVTLQHIRIINVQNSNYSYKDFYAHGGAVHTPSLSISATEKGVSFSNNEIYQGICTEAAGEGKGGAVYITDSLSITGNNSNVMLSQNNILVANTAEGGALYLESGSTGTISGNELHVQLMGNDVKVAPDEDFSSLEGSLKATCEARGGAVYVGGELLVEQNKGNVLFESNAATADYSLVATQSHENDHVDDPAYALGGAVYIAENAGLSISNNGTAGKVELGNVSFTGNSVSATGTSKGIARGGAVYADSKATLTICGNNGWIAFSGNFATEGGALFLAADSAAEFSGNKGAVSFSGNSATEGGALFLAADSAAEFSGNKDAVSFSGNSATEGGAIYAQGAFSVENNIGGVAFTGNTAKTYGGAIYANADISLSSNGGGVRFTGNSATQAGGAIFVTKGCTVDIVRNQTEVLLADNDSQTGAIHLTEGATLNISDNTAGVIFKTTITNVSVGQDAATLYGELDSTMRISANDSFTVTSHETIIGSAVRTAGAVWIENNRGEVVFSANSALNNSAGGVFTLEGDKAQLVIRGNKGNIIATGNYALESGGVIYADSAATIEICDNADVTITDNSSCAGAAAIDTQGSLRIDNNAGSVIFGNNAVYDETTKSETLRSISAAGQASFSAASGHSIEFRDSIAIGSGESSQPALILNKTDSDAAGDIIFSGEYTDSYAAESNIRVNTEDSRYSRVQGDTILHAGRLIVSHRATLEGDTLTTTADHGAIVELHDGGTLAQEHIIISSGSILRAGAGTVLPAAEPETELTLSELIDSTPVCGYLDGAQLTMESGSTYAMNGGILDLNGGTLTLAAADTPMAHLYLHSTLAPSLLGDEYVLLLFSGVSELTVNGDYIFSHAGHLYGAEQLVFDDSRRVVYLHGINIPEPSSAALLLTALAILVAGRRKRSKS